MRDVNDIITAATLRYDPTSHISWLETECKPSEATRAALKAEGWRWGGYRQQWYNNRRFPTVPATISIMLREECDYSSERADRLQQSAERHAARSDAAYKRSHDAVAMIPLGQPILVGHHSEKGHRAALARSWAAMDKSVEEAKTAERLRYGATSSAHHQASKSTPEAMQRRLDRLSAEQRAMERNHARRTRQLAALGEEENANDREYTRRIALIAEECADLQKRIADAGGILADQLNVEVGDIVRACGFPALVVRVNRKTYSLIFQEATGWKAAIDRTKVTAILRKHATPDEAPDEGSETPSIA